MNEVWLTLFEGRVLLGFECEEARPAFEVNWWFVSCTPESRLWLVGLDWLVLDLMGWAVGLGFEFDDSRFACCLETADCLEVGKAEVITEAYAVLTLVIILEFKSVPTARQVWGLSIAIDVGLGALVCKIEGSIRL